MTSAATHGPEADLSQQLQDAVGAAARNGTPLRIVGGESKAFYGRTAIGTPLDVSGHGGIISYQPTELVVTARAGTPLRVLEATLAEHGQMLAFEPPHFGAGATLGGTIACGLSGPRRPYSGAARDFVLGVTVITGKGERLRFGGEVMKNVAGYDVARLMSGALGTLGLLLDVSLKVLPQPTAEITVTQEELDATQVLHLMNRWAGRPLPLSAACYDGDRLFLRLSGTPRSVADAREKLGGETLAEGDEFWRRLNEHRHGFFAGPTPLWRVSVSPTAPPLDLPGKTLIDWGGAQRWVKTDAPAALIRTAAERAGGHAMLFRGGERDGEVFHPLPGPLAALQRKLKQAFDPQGVLNPGRMYRDW